MNELELKTLDLVPAKISFNKQAVKEELNEMLKSYNNLVYTGDKTADMRRDLATLRKAVKAADEFRKVNKKIAIEPVTTFENEIKEIIALINETIKPIDKELKEIVEAEKLEKRTEIEALIVNIVADKNLSEEQAKELIIHDEMLTKSRSLSGIKETLEFRADQLIQAAEQQESNKLLITQSVELANAKHGFSLAHDPYIRLLEFQSVKEVTATIEQHVENELNKRLIEEKKAAELAIKEAEVVKPVAPIVEDVPFTPQENELPFGDVEITETRIYTITATTEQLKRIENNMDINDIDWSVE